MKWGRLNEHNLKARIREIMGTYLDLSEYEVFVFGSRAAGNATERSDIDIGIEGPERIPGAMMMDIQDALEDLPYLQKIDVVDMHTVEPKKYQVMTQHTEPLVYE
ncbi:MAG: nucleotidyltransferase domain-containing protein [Parcubacteria group bacterium SW_4_49_11]|nr:MAG: nucleotidyltransferase domain-containing protein [Parcubacteria group bacterium SW_4_49_11]